MCARMPSICRRSVQWRREALVTLIRMETDTEHLPHLERVTQHEQLGFSIAPVRMEEPASQV